jgi:hypothetical protein
VAQSIPRSYTDCIDRGPYYETAEDTAEHRLHFAGPKNFDEAAQQIVEELKRTGS